MYYTLRYAFCKGMKKIYFFFYRNFKFIKFLNYHCRNKCSQKIYRFVGELSPLECRWFIQISCLNNSNFHSLEICSRMHEFEAFYIRKSAMLVINPSTRHKMFTCSQKVPQVTHSSSCPEVRSVMHVLYFFGLMYLSLSSSSELYNMTSFRNW